MSPQALHQRRCLILQRLILPHLIYQLVILNVRAVDPVSLMRGYKTIDVNARQALQVNKNGTVTLTSSSIYASHPMKGKKANIADSDQTPRTAASDQGLQYLHLTIGYFS